MSSKDKNAKQTKTALNIWPMTREDEREERSEGREGKYRENILDKEPIKI